MYEMHDLWPIHNGGFYVTNGYGSAHGNGAHMFLLGSVRVIGHLAATLEFGWSLES